MSLSPAQYQSKLDSQSAIARKVLSVVPLAEAWSREQIRAEIRRQSGAGIENRTVDGCLHNLEEAGLVRQVKTHHYQATPHREKPVKANESAAKLTAKCDGNHGGPRCADPGCWNDDPPTGRAILARQEEALARGAAALSPKPAFTLAEPVAKAIKREDLLLRLETLSDRLIDTAAELDSIRKQVRAELEAADAKVVKLDQLTALLDSLRP